jgi:hypothetical protein
MMTVSPAPLCDNSSPVSPIMCMDSMDRSLETDIIDAYSVIGIITCGFNGPPIVNEALALDWDYVVIVQAHEDVRLVAQNPDLLMRYFCIEGVVHPGWPTHSLRHDFDAVSLSGYDSDSFQISVVVVSLDKITAISQSPEPSIIRTLSPHGVDAQSYRGLHYGLPTLRHMSVIKLDAATYILEEADVYLTRAQPEKRGAFGACTERIMTGHWLYGSEYMKGKVRCAIAEKMRNLGIVRDDHWTRILTGRFSFSRDYRFQLRETPWGKALHSIPAQTEPAVKPLEFYAPGF